MKIIKFEMGDKTDKLVDVRLIEVFDGVDGKDICEWLSKVEVVCKLRGMENDLAVVIPLRLQGGAFAVYQQLSDSDKKDADKVKKILKQAFATDNFAAYDQFIGRKLGPGESVDVYLADLKRLAGLFGGVSDSTLTCAFVSGLPEHVKQSLRVGARLGEMVLQDIVQRAREIMVNDVHVAAAAVTKDASPTFVGSMHRKGECFQCGRSDHWLRDCPIRKARRAEGRCYRCNSDQHLANRCQGNEGKEKASAPAFSGDQA